jgi:peptidoglycan-associated lipoprotein
MKLQEDRMNRKMTRTIIVFFCVTLFAAGCAKKELVKSEEPIAPPTAVEKAPAVTTPAEKPAPETPAVKEETLQETTKEAAPAATMETIHFDFDSYVLSAEARDILKKNADWMTGNPTAKVQVQGNCDERGSAEYNLALGENRAKAAAKYLETLGIASDRLSTISFGKEKPVDTGNNEAAWAKNRRDDFVIIY